MATDIAAFETRAKALRDHEDSKWQVIDELLEEVTSLRQEVDDKQNVIDRGDLSKNALLDSLDKTTKQLEAKERAIKRSSFVSVLVDGDHMLFEDELVRKKEVGGREAAQRLRDAVLEYTKNHLSEVASNAKLVVRVYANLKGLFRPYRDNSILLEPSELEAFIRGFNVFDPLIDFIDAGSGKECADVKLQKNFELHEANVHCNQIFFAASADNGYARLLGPYVGKRQSADRIVLVEGPPFAAELAELAHKFRHVTFPGVFRSSKLTRRVSFSITPPKSPAATYSTAAAAVAPAELPNGASKGARTSSQTPKSKIMRSSDGKRIDPPMRFDYTKEFVLVKNRKMCNDHYLLGRCKYERCQYDHNRRMTASELDLLRQISRLSACPEGPWCNDEDCIKGHHCQKKGCTHEKCAFQSYPQRYVP